MMTLFCIKCLLCFKNDLKMDYESKLFYSLMCFLIYCQNANIIQISWFANKQSTNGGAILPAMKDINNKQKHQKSMR